MRLTAATVVFTALVITPSPARAADSADEILRRLAAAQTHSWIHNGIGYDAMMQRYLAGERLYVTCGYVAEIARRLLRSAGYPARVVQTFTREDYDYVNDGHVMTEVFVEGRWQLYDVDANGRAVDDGGRGVSVVEQVAAVREGRARWAPIASDSLFNEDEPDEALRESARRAFSDLPALYARLMGVALLPGNPFGKVDWGMYFTDEDQAQRLGGYGDSLLILASEATWRTLTTSPGRLPPDDEAPVEAETTVVVASPPPPPTVTEAPPEPLGTVSPAAKPACAWRGRPVHRRSVPCRVATRVLRRYVRTRHAGRWTCRVRRAGRVTCRADSRRRVGVTVPR
jgi:hypothetical protein